MILPLFHITIHNKSTDLKVNTWKCFAEHTITRVAVNIYPVMTNRLCLF